MKKIIVFSSCGSANSTGNFAFNGGMKLYNIWVKLLRNNGYESYIMTYGGDYKEWLIEHQPVISFDRVISLKKEGYKIIGITCWIDSPGFLSLCDELYFYDCELAYTSTGHFNLLKEKISGIKKIGVNNRYAHAWYNINFPNAPVQLVREWSDEDYWKPDDSKRVLNRIGYMSENEQDNNCMEEIKRRVLSRIPEAEFFLIEGIESNVLKGMQSCDIFLGLNRGKHPIWGEGCPRTQQEAMHAGAIVVAFDVRGNREYLFHGYNGFLGSANEIPDTIIKILQDKNLKEKVRLRSIDFAMGEFSSTNRFETVKDFIDL